MTVDNVKTHKSETPSPTPCLDCPALEAQSKHYPASWYGKVPKKVRMAKTVMSETPFPPLLQANSGKEFYVWVNIHGAVAVIFDDGKKLGVKPYEFEIIEWHEDR